jgi:preprotein translocase subunit YajC
VYLATAKSGGGNSVFLILLLVGLVFYVLFFRNMRRKQQAQANAQKDMRNALEIGTEIVTIGGLYGTVVGGDDDSVMLEVADGVIVQFDRNAIAKVITHAEAEEADTTAVQTDSTDLDATADSVIERKD